MNVLLLAIQIGCALGFVVLLALTERQVRNADRAAIRAKASALRAEKALARMEALVRPPRPDRTHRSNRGGLT